MSIDLILYVVAFILLLLDGFGVAAKVTWHWLAAAALVLTLIV